jgi:hypothetical protein
VPIIIQAPRFMDLMGKFFGGITPSGMSIWPLILVRDKAKLSETTLRHEAIHNKQQKELTYVAAAILAIVFLPIVLFGLPAIIVAPFAVLAFPNALQGLIYGAFHVVGIVLFNGAEHPVKRAYRSNPFELEAYGNDEDPGYLIQRRLFGWLWYVSAWRERIEKFDAKRTEEE